MRKVSWNYMVMVDEGITRVSTFNEAMNLAQRYDGIIGFQVVMPEVVQMLLSGIVDLTDGERVTVRHE
jgi:hypothetical protein